VSARYFPHMGGLETHVYEVARRLKAGGADVSVLTTDPEGRLPTRDMVDDVPIRRVRSWPADRDYYFAPGIGQAISEIRPDLIHCQGTHTFAPPLTMLAAQRAGIPYVLSFHSGGHSSGLRNAIRGIQWQALRPLLAGARRLVAVSQFEAEHFQRQLRLPRDRFTVIPNGSQLPKPDAADRSTESGTLILSVGRLEQYKGHHRVIGALPTILRQRPDVRLRIIGSGPYERELRTLAARLGVSRRVEIGSIPPSDRRGMAGALADAALVVLLSEYEAHPISVMEALAMGRRVVVADTSGLGEIARKGLAHAIPLKSTASDVAAAVLSQLDRTDGPPQVELPTWEQCVGRLEGLYAEVIGRDLAGRVVLPPEPDARGRRCAS